MFKSIPMLEVKSPSQVATDIWFLGQDFWTVAETNYRERGFPAAALIAKSCGDICGDMAASFSRVKV